MTTPAKPAIANLSLQHAWLKGSDASALALCREQLLGIGMTLSDAMPGDACDVIKMHGMDIHDARNAKPGALQDLRCVALEWKWAEWLPELLRHHMQAGDSWHGIPLGIHQSSRMWINPAWAEKLGSPPSGSWPDFLHWLAQAKRHIAGPLAVGAEPWQIGVLFEAVVLATGGKRLYNEAFVDTRPEVWRDPSMLQALEHLMALRAYVDDRALVHGWAFQASRVACGEAAVQFMGDWARQANPGLVELPAPGTASWFVAVVDYLVPLARTPQPVAELAARALTDPAFQSRFAMCKSCIPVMHTSSSWQGRQLPEQQHLLPSVAFEQCCTATLRRPMLEVVARHFVGRSDAAACALALAEVAR